MPNFKIWVYVHVKKQNILNISRRLDSETKIFEQVNSQKQVCRFLSFFLFKGRRPNTRNYIAIQNHILKV